LANNLDATELNRMTARAEWRMPAGDYLRDSTLDTIHPSNAKDLRVITTFRPAFPTDTKG